MNCQFDDMVKYYCKSISLYLHKKSITMTQIILKDDIEQRKIDALLFFLKSWDIDAELKITQPNKSKSNEFSLSQGIWSDYEIDASELRDKAWKR